MIKRFARFILRHDLREKDAALDSMGKRIRELGADLDKTKGMFPKESIFYPLEKSEDSMETWSKIKQLIDLEGWKLLLRYLYGECEAQEQEVGASNAHRFWYYQGQKSVLASLWTLADMTKKKLYHFAGVRERKEAHGEAPVEQPYQ